MNEFQLIERYFQQPTLAFKNPYLALGIGDDCAQFSIANNLDLNFSIDTLVEDVHFPAGAKAYDIATRALCVSISDLAAMAAMPIGFTLAITLPSLDESWLADFCEGLAFIAQKFNCPLIGGDTTKGPNLVISVQVHGITEKGKSLTRSGAQEGDKVYVSGPMGDGGGALPLVLQKPTLNTGLAKYFYQPLPKIEFAQAIAAQATACLDVSDGLVQDLNHLCQASNVAMEIDPSCIPLSDLLLDHYDQEQALKFALSGGDDYQLAYTAPHCDQGICIGEVVAGNGVTVLGFEVNQTGYQHF